MKKRNFFVIAVIALIGVAFIFNACKPDDDTTKPVITLKGSTDMTIVYNSSWTDPGYTANDDKDGDITSKVTVSPSMNTNSAGSVTLTYSVTDAAGNTGTATRKVTVDAAPFLAGSYSVVDVSNGATTPYTDNATASSTDKNKLYFAKFGDYSGALVYITLSGNLVTLPSQTVKCGLPPNDIDHTFSGTGTFTTSKGINITFSDVSSLGTYTGCTETYTHL